MNETQHEENAIVNEIMEALISCEKCHFCNTVCPILDCRITQGSFGINRSIYYGLKWDELDTKLRDLVYSCTTCGKCVEMCKKVSRALPLVDVFEKMREYLLIEKMMGPMPEQVNVLKNMHIQGNPWGNPSHERTKWDGRHDVPFASEANPVDVLYFVGCASSYDPQAQKIAKNLSTILKTANINFGILEGETCSGHEAKRMGETGLFAYLAEANMNMFMETKASRIVTGDPHGFYSFTHEYPEQMKSFHVQHYSQFLNELLDEGKLNLTKKQNKTITYHDPCYLGRRSGIYEDPRNLIKKVPGVTLVEMENTRAESNCCGMGGGRMWTELPHDLLPSQTLGEKRVLEAIATDADILVTACPFCNITLNDAVKSLGQEDTIEVIDITELVIRSL